MKHIFKNFLARIELFYLLELREKATFHNIALYPPAE